MKKLESYMKKNGYTKEFTEKLVKEALTIVKILEGCDEESKL